MFQRVLDILKIHEEYAMTDDNWSLLRALAGARICERRTPYRKILSLPLYWLPPDLHGQAVATYLLEVTQ